MMILPPILFLFYSNRSCSLRLRQFQFGRIAILSHLAHLAFFLLRRKSIQPGDSSRRLLIRHLEFLALSIESGRVPLVSTPLRLAHPIAANGPAYRARSSRLKLAADTFLKLISFAPILIDRWASAHILGAQGHTSAGAQVPGEVSFFTVFPLIMRPTYPLPSAPRHTPSL